MKKYMIYAFGGKGRLIPKRNIPMPKKQGERGYKKNVF
jgi:hypothetical protein